MFPERILGTAPTIQLASVLSAPKKWKVSASPYKCLCKTQTWAGLPNVVTVDVEFIFSHSEPKASSRDDRDDVLPVMKVSHFI